MTAAPLPQLMTADELMELPEDGHSYELSRGMLICMSPSSYLPGRVAGRVMVRLFAFVDQRGLGDVGSSDTGFRLAHDPDTVRAPDAWFVSAERVAGSETLEKFFDGPPDLAVEVLSPSDRFSDVMQKVRDYLEAGTPLTWVFDPRSRVTAIFRPGQPVRFLDEDDTLDGEDILPGFSLPLRDVFR